jgi:hypothetical protein
MITGSDVVKKLANIAEAVALEECEAKQHGREPCPVQYDDAEEWCLPCQVAWRAAVRDNQRNLAGGKGSATARLDLGSAREALSEQRASVVARAPPCGSYANASHLQH